jgi:hypothetical protein
MEIRPPVIERTYDSSTVEHLFGGEIKHTIEPELTYRYVTGISDFLNVLRFDDVDVASDTNELEYGVTQRLFLHPVKVAPLHCNGCGCPPAFQQECRKGTHQGPLRQPRVDQLALGAEVFF